jgi:predicted Ser/Thr protein kinase
MTGPDREGAIERVIADYLAAEDAGTPPDRAAILASHPELADDLRTFFREHDQFGRLAAPLRADPAPTVDLPGAASAADGKEGPALPPGRHIRYFGDYEILEELGRGGMGVVYKARQISLNRPVALKMIRAGLLAGDDDLRRFQNEAEAVALLDHPGIVPVYEVGELDGQRYFSMKLIEGGGLAPLPEAYRDDPRAAARLVADAAEAMAHAHARGVLHRDLKPANLLIDAAGRPHVTDFGLAKRLAEQVELTQSGAILGTPAYMSPEQAAGRRGTITTAADVYGLGAVLYSLLTGKAPFGGNSLVETLDAVRVAAPAPPTRLNAKVPRDLQTICLKCLEKDPRRRYATAQGLADDLRAWLENRPIAARPAGVLERGALFARRRPALAAAYLLAAAVVSLAAFGGTSAWLWRAAERARAEAEAARSRLAAVEYGRTVEAAHQEWRDDDVAGTIALLDGTRPELRGWEWRYVHSLCHPELTTIVDPKGAIVEASFDTGRFRPVTVLGCRERCRALGDGRTHRGRSGISQPRRVSTRHPGRMETHRPNPRREDRRRADRPRRSYRPRLLRGLRQGRLASRDRERGRDGEDLECDGRFSAPHAQGAQTVVHLLCDVQPRRGEGRDGRRRRGGEDLGCRDGRGAPHAEGARTLPESAGVQRGRVPDRDRKRRQDGTRLGRRERPRTPHPPWPHKEDPVGVV